MNDLPRLCLCCMSVLDGSGACPECGNTEEIIQPSPYLPLQTVINDKYIIGVEKKKNPEGITYIAYDKQRRAAVSIREFYPDAIAVRSPDNVTVLPFNNQRSRFIGCMNSFLSLWRTLADLKNLPSLITVYDIIEQNGTVYAVYAEPERISLRDYLLQTEPGYLTWQQAELLFGPVFETVAALNDAGIIHRGISPSSLIVGNDGTLKLTNFGILQVRSEGSVLRPELFEGYAALEQYDSPVNQGAWTDTYALAASLYRTLTGVMPINAPSRAKEDLMMFPAFFTETIPAHVINGIIGAMEIYPENRLRNTVEFGKVLGLLADDEKTSPDKPESPPTTPETRVQHPPEKRPVQRPDDRGSNPEKVRRPAPPSEKKPKHDSPTHEPNTAGKGKTVFLIILLVIVLLLLLVGIAVTVKGIIGNAQILPVALISDNSIFYGLL